MHWFLNILCVTESPAAADYKTTKAAWFPEAAFEQSVRRMTQYRLRAPFLGFGQDTRKTAGKSRIHIATHAAIHRAEVRAREPDCQRQLIRVGWITGA